MLLLVSASYLVVEIESFAPRNNKLCSNRSTVSPGSCIFEAVQDTTTSTDQDESLIVEAVEKKFGSEEGELLRLELPEFRPLGCTVEESLDTESDPKVVFVSKVVEGGNAEKAGLRVGDVVVGVNGLFDDTVVPVIEAGLEKM